MEEGIYTYCHTKASRTARTSNGFLCLPTFGVWNDVGIYTYVIPMVDVPAKL